MCHRAEDLVTYLYGEATAEEALDFAGHMQQCDACRAEFSVFNQVHESIVTWRNEALGPIASPVREEVAFVTPEVMQSGRRMPAFAALREFFSVSPLWLRGATAFAGLLLCALLVFAVSRLWQKPAQIAGADLKYTEQQFREAVQKEVAQRIAALNQKQAEESGPNVVKDSSGTQEKPLQLAADRNRTRPQPRSRLTREERVQLAADLGLIQAREDEMPFVLPDEPNQ
jgi:hypothetical protein